MTAENQQKEPATIPVQTAAKLLMLTTHRVRQLVDDGYIPAPTTRNTYSLVGVVQGYIRFLKDDERRANRSEAESALKTARQKEIEIRTAERLGRLIDWEDVQFAFRNNMDIFRSELESLPKAITRDVAQWAAMEAAIELLIGRYHARFVEMADRLQSGKDPLGDDDDAE